MDGSWSILDPAGNVIAKDFEDLIPVHPVTSLVLVKKNGKWGAIKPDGTVALTCSDESLDALYQRIADCTRKGYKQAEPDSEEQIIAAAQCWSAHIADFKQYNAEKALVEDIYKTVGCKDFIRVYVQVYNLDGDEAVKKLHKLRSWEDKTQIAKYYKRHQKWVHLQEALVKGPISSLGKPLEEYRSAASAQKYPGESGADVVEEIHGYFLRIKEQHVHNDDDILSFTFLIPRKFRGKSLSENLKVYLTEREMEIAKKKSRELVAAVDKSRKTVRRSEDRRAYLMSNVKELVPELYKLSASKSNVGGVIELAPLSRSLLIINDSAGRADYFLTASGEKKGKEDLFAEALNMLGQTCHAHATLDQLHLSENLITYLTRALNIQAATHLQSLSYCMHDSLWQMDVYKMMKREDNNSVRKALQDIQAAAHEQLQKVKGRQQQDGVTYLHQAYLAAVLGATQPDIDALLKMAKTHATPVTEALCLRVMGHAQRRMDYFARLQISNDLWEKRVKEADEFNRQALARWKAEKEQRAAEREKRRLAEEKKRQAHVQALRQRQQWQAQQYYQEQSTQSWLDYYEQRRDERIANRNKHLLRIARNSTVWSLATY